MTPEELEQLKEANAFADPANVSLTPEGIVWDERTETPYRFVSAQVELAERLGIKAGPRMASAFEPCHQQDGAPCMVQGVACQLDVLGTRAASQQQTEAHLAVTHRALAAAQAFGARFDDVSTRWFTDNALIGAAERRAYENGLAGTGVILVAASIQLELVQQGLFLRGGLADGSLYLSEQFAYGNALVDAYALESGVAHYPRIVASAAIRGRLEREYMPEVLDVLLARDHDGLTFVSYLGLLLDPASDRDLRAVLARHRQAITSQISATEGIPRLAAKYGWVANYHDRFCRAHLPDEAKLLVDADHHGALRSWR